MEISRTDFFWSIFPDGKIVSNLGNDHDVLPTLLKVVGRLHTKIREEYDIQIDKNKKPDKNENKSDDTSEQWDVENNIGCDDIVGIYNDATTEQTTTGSS